MSEGNASGARRLRGAGLTVLGLMLGGLASCSSIAPHPGRETFLNYCAGCHGAQGLGNGPAADGLPVRPADLSALRAANDGVFPARRVMETIYGYPGKHEARIMPEFGPLLEGPQRIWVSPEGEEIMTPVALLDLVDYLETLQR